MAEDSDGIDPNIAENFNALDSSKSASISLTKDDVALLINSLAELHRSYAAFLKAPYIHYAQTEDDKKNLGAMTEGATASYNSFARLANSLMSRFIDGAKK